MKIEIKINDATWRFWFSNEIRTETEPQKMNAHTDELMNPFSDHK